MTLDEITAEMQRLADHVGDRESDHLRADDLVCQALYHLGANELADAYDKAKKEYWYA